MLVSGKSILAKVMLSVVNAHLSLELFVSFYRCPAVVVSMGSIRSRNVLQNTRRSIPDHAHGILSVTWLDQCQVEGEDDTSSPTDP